MMLEAVVHPTASFATLTYKDVPDGNSLNPSHVQLWLKRLRKQTQLPIRYFLCGEYGDQSERPHYHAALFGLSPLSSDVVRNTWGHGHILLGDLTLHSAQYVAGYVTKKMTSADDKRLNGRYPEFARMSLRPGIGAPALSQVAAALQNKHGWDEITSTADVPGMLRHGRRTMPLGRYMRTRLRSEMNFQELTQSDEATFLRHQKMLDVYRDLLTPEEAASPYQLYKGKIRHEENEKVRMDQLDARLRATTKAKKL